MAHGCQLGQGIGDGDTLVSTDQHKPAISLQKVHTQMYVDGQLSEDVYPAHVHASSNEKTEHTKSA